MVFLKLKVNLYKIWFSMSFQPNFCNYSISSEKYIDESISILNQSYNN